MTRRSVWYLRAADLLEEDRGFLFDESARGAYVEDKVEFYNTAILHLLDRRRVQEAFDLMERSRSRVMADLIATKDIALSSPRERLLYADRLQLHGRNRTNPGLPLCAAKRKAGGTELQQGGRS